ncbi:MAG: hypothetical protein SGJ02_10180 [bacterium]|nr:hypothetical protein [bacterium]
MKRSLIKATAFLILCGSLTGCVIGTKMKFSDTSLQVPTTKGMILVGALDRRPYVISGEKSPKWVGLQRSGFGIPYGVHTSSGLPLATEFRDGLQRNFNSSKSVNINSNSNFVEQLKSLMAKETALGESNTKGLLLVINQWKTDVMNNVNLYYDLELIALDKNGNVGGRAQLASNEKLKGSFWNPVAASERVAKEKLKAVLDKLLMSPEIARALAG